MLIATAILLAAAACCYFPMFFVTGPLTCGLCCCALRTVRRQPVDARALERGWQRVGPSMVASIIMQFLQMLPLVMLYAALIALMIVLMTIMPTAVEVPGAGALGPPQEPSPEVALLMLGILFLFYALMMLMMFVFVVWSFLIGTRLMFVMPLLADRDVGVREAFRLSWNETGREFWALLVLYVVASIIGMIGCYVFYVGLIFTLPIGMTIIAAAYEERFGQTVVTPSAEGESPFAPS